MSPERVRSFVPIETALLPRPLGRFGRAFPAAVAEQYVNAYAGEHGVVLDPLAHPASAADAARRLGRRAIGRSPHLLATWVAGAMDRAPRGEELLAAFEKVGRSALGDKPHALAMRELYGSRCATCRAPIVVEAFLWERDALAPTKKAFRCVVCAREGKALLIEPIDAEDEERAISLESRGLQHWQLVERFAEVERGLGESVSGLFTPRNLAALMGTLRAIETQVADGPARDVLLVAFVEVVIGGSRLNTVSGHGTPLRVERGHARRGHAALTREINVWLEYERTLRDLIAWLADRPAMRRTREFASAEDLPGKADLVLCEAPPDDELGAWTHVATVLCLGAERAGIIESDARGNARDRSVRRLRQALMDAHRRSREDAPAVVYVSRADLPALASCALGASGAGYRLRGILFQRDALAAATRSDGGAGAAVLDFDRAVPLLKDQQPADAAAIEETIRRGVREAIIARGEPVGPEVGGAGALLALSRAELLPSLALARAGGVSELEVFMDHFRSALGDAKRTGLERVGDGADGAPALIGLSGALDTTPLDDRVEWAVWGLLAATREIDGPSLLKRAYSLFRDIETPDRELVERCVAAYGTETGGRWRLREEDALVRRQTEQAALAVGLLDAGRRLGFKVHIGRDLERRPLPESHAGRGAVLADLMTEGERTVSLGKFARGPADGLELIDVVWYDRGHMVFLWQLEWTARIHRSIVQLGESIHDDDRVFRFLAVADERRGLVGYKLLRSTALAEAVRRRAWRFVKWGPLRRFAADPEAVLGDLEGVLGLEPAVEQAGQQLAFKW